MPSYLNDTTYIPQLQQFNPDFNFFQGALQTKESQYQAGYNKISGLYGSLLNSPMLGQDNIDRRDQFFKTVNDHIQKLSGMDLSLEENVDSAYKVFQPLIDDQNIRKDIVFTKTSNSELQRGEGFRNCLDDQKCGGRFDSEAIKAIHYQMNDFRNADSDTRMKMDNPRFTPYVDIAGKAMKMAKDLDINISRTSFSPDGKWIVTDKNGLAMEPALADMLIGSLGHDPKVQDMYQTKAYVAMKDFATNNADKYGSEQAAENFYLQNALSTTSNEATKSVNGLDRAIEMATAKRDIHQQRLEEGTTTNPRKTQSNIDSYEDQIAQAGLAKALHENTLRLTDRSALLGASNLALRRNVNGAVANYLMNSHIKQAALDYSLTHGSSEIKENPYAMASVHHMYALDELHQKGLQDLDIEQMKWGMKLEFEAKKKYADTRGGLSENQLSPMDPTHPLAGTFTADQTRPTLEDLNRVTLESKDITKHASSEYVQNLTDYYKGILDPASGHSESEKKVAKQSLQDIYQGNIDPQTFEIKGNPMSGSNWSNIYQRALANTNKNMTLLDDSHLLQLSQRQREVNEGYNLWGGYDKLMNSNNQKVLHYVDTKASSIEYPQPKKDSLHFLVHEDGTMNTYSQWAQQYASKYGIRDPKQLNKIYSDTQDDYRRIYSIDGLTKSWDGSSVTGGVGGAYGANPVRGNVDGANFNSANLQGMISLQRNLDHYNNDPDVHVVPGGANGFESIKAATSSGADTEAKMKQILKLYTQDLQTNYHPTDSNRPMNNVVVENVAAGNPDMTGVHMTFSYNWLKKQIGTKNDPGLTKGLVDQLSQEGMTVLIPRDKADNDFIQGLKTKKEDILLNQGPQSRNFMDAGSFTMKKDAKGYIATGQLRQYDPNTKTYTTIPINGERFDPSVGGQNAMNYWNQKFQTQFELNQKYKQQVAQYEHNNSNNGR